MLLYKSSNFLLDGRHCGVILLSIWTLLLSFKKVLDFVFAES